MTVAAPGLSLAELEAILTRTDPAVVLVRPRILRRVIKQHHGLGGLGLKVPHYKTCVLGRDALLQIADRDALGIQPGRELPATVILLTQPDARSLRSRSAERILLGSWRLLFHARVHAALDSRKLDEATVLDRVRHLGSAVFNEARAVLRQEHFLLPPHPTLSPSGGEGRVRGGDEKTVYEEFAAVYLELRYFARHLLPRYFPAIADFDAVDHLLAADVDADDLFTRTRPDGAPLPRASPVDHDEEEEETETGEAPLPVSVDTGTAPLADRAAARGNDVRAARLQLRAGHRPAALAAVRRLVDRLQNALRFPETEAAQWRASLEALLEPAARGLWPMEARLLYDLQRVCVDQEKEIYALDLVEWAVTWGQRPVKRLLPHQPFVLTVKYLRRALHRLTAAQVSDEVRHVLHSQLEHALHQAERRLRERFRPLIRGALDDVDLRPTNYAERVARETVVEAMLDRIAERGFLTMSDLRDALARNRLKLPDVANPGEILLGDKLLKANRKLAVALDGVYRRGEIYMRWLQRLSSVLFGTNSGRFLVLYLIMPLLLGAFAVKGPKLLWDEIRHYSRKALSLVGVGGPHVEQAHTNAEHAGDGEPAETATHEPGKRPHKPFFTQDDAVPIAAASVFMLGLIHLPILRRLVFSALHWAAWALWYILHDVPAGFLHLRAVRSVLQSRGYLLGYQFLLKPGCWGVAAGLILWQLGMETTIVCAGAGGLFLLAELILNSRIGLRVEETCTDGLVRGWHLFKEDVLPGLFRRVMGFFKWMVEGVDRISYVVDEWLRFRPGDSRLSLAIKPVVGLMWFFVTYVVRFAVNLLIEPQINPIKHFPVVTVSHKLILPMVPTVAETFGMSLTTTTTIAFGIPGIFGFLVWELKENWKLYRANQSPELRPLTIGSHGESMLRLMRPGFHSGTLPKLYAKLRRCERRRHATKARKRREDLHHVEEAVRHFAERGFVAVLEGSHAWGTTRTLYVGPVHAATNQIRIEIVSATRILPEGSDTSVMRRLNPESLEIAFEEQAGWLVAGVARPGWLEKLGREERLALADALAGFYKMAGVDLVREQVAAVLPPGATWSMSDSQLIVWHDGRTTSYDPSDAAALPWGRVLFGRSPLRWEDWVAAWQRDQDGKAHEPLLLPDVRLLP